MITSTMGTRSRVVIKSESKKDIVLWIQYDGYLEGVGNYLCMNMRKLLDRYTVEQLKKMASNIKPKSLHDDVVTEYFKVDKIVPMFEGTYVPYQDECDDYAYEYVIDMTKEHVGFRLVYTQLDILLIINFDDIKKGLLLSEVYNRHIYNSSDN